MMNMTLFEQAVAVGRFFWKTGQRNFKWIFALAISASFLLLPSSALAQEPTIDEVNQVAKHLNCPTCDTRSLDDCNTQTCIQWREQIRDLMVQGYTENEIIDWYVERYGEYVLQEPRFNGLGMLAWLLPLVGLMMGAVWLAFVLKNWSSRKLVPATVEVTVEPAPDAATSETDDYLQQVEQDLKRL